ncbi:MAG: twin-arginine translocase subunit TatC [Anaerolineaceae bacterium]|nr:twin-arginine translocase subunit TatC [Anaerolineaceae bacterium]
MKPAAEGKSMTLWEHLGELRIRLFKALIALVLTTFISFLFAEKLVDILARPIGGIGAMVSIEVTENISIFMKVSLLSGFVLAFPPILYQLLAFILPGLTPKEKQWVLMIIPVGFLLFVSGVVFAYYVLLPTALPFLINFMGIRTIPRPVNYFSFVTNLLFWIGVCFEMPLLVYVLARFKVVTPGLLARQWRVAVLIIAILAAVITPTPDPVNMGLLMIPLFALYLLSILFARLAIR